MLVRGYGLAGLLLAQVTAHQAGVERFDQIVDVQTQFVELCRELGLLILECRLAATAASLALTASGEIWAAGDGQYGNFGMARQNGLATWTLVPGTSDFDATAAGFAHSLAVKRDGSLWVTGGSTTGWSGLGLGLPFDAGAVQQWTKVNAVASVTAIAAGADYSLVVTSEGSLWATGNNSAGQLGLGDQNYRSAWTKTNLEDVVAVSTGVPQSFAIQRDGTVWAAGGNGQGTLGLGDREIRSSWTRLKLPVGAKAVAGSNIHSVAILRDGTIWETGDGSSSATPFGEESTIWQQSKGLTGF
jgi:alpha-tubulin suppressor-like RCC1 family protein